MSKAKLIKKDSPMQEQVLLRRKTRRQRKPPQPTVRNAFEMTAVWLKAKREEAGGAREAFAALFGNTDPQSA